MFVSSHAAVSFGESSARRLLSQRSPTAGEWSSPGEPFHPGEYGGSTGRIGSDRELTLIRGCASRPKDSGSHPYALAPQWKRRNAAFPPQRARVKRCCGARRRVAGL